MSSVLYHRAKRLPRAAGKYVLQPCVGQGLMFTLSEGGVGVQRSGGKNTNQFGYIGLVPVSDKRKGRGTMRRGWGGADEGRWKRNGTNWEGERAGVGCQA